MFVDVMAKSPGGVYYSWILSRSALFNTFEGNHRPINGFLLGRVAICSKRLVANSS